ncbi:MAG: MaoC/PaaZ C-terminal domain-containing protein [Thermoplasmata archaeon]
MTSENKITGGRTITETDLVMFTYFTGDWLYLHTDKVAAEKSIFGERVAHGYLTLAVSLGLMVRSGAINTDVFLALKSIENVRFLKPVKIGDTLSVSYSIERKESQDGKIIVRTAARTFNQRNECVMEFTTIHIERMRIGGNNSNENIQTVKE